MFFIQLDELDGAEENPDDENDDQEQVSSLAKNQKQANKKKKKQVIIFFEFLYSINKQNFKVEIFRKLLKKRQRTIQA